MSKTLDKGAIPRITQEIYYTCSSDGTSIINAELCIDEFLDKLKALQISHELFFNLDKAIEKELGK